MAKIIKKMGDTFSSAIMINFPLLMGYGILANLFSKQGYFPVVEIESIVTLLGTILIPFAIAFSSGYLQYEKKGGCIGLLVVSGIIFSDNYLNLIGIIIVSTLSVWLFKKVEKTVKGRLIGFEMITSNLFVIIYSIPLMLVNLYAVVPFLDYITILLLEGINKITDTGSIILLSLIIEPAKIFNLNNIINGVFLTPIGLEQANISGNSILFFIEANPGPGLGILLAYVMVSKNKFRKDAFKSSGIHLLGGVHELYFPYVLMNPWLFLALIIGGCVGTLLCAGFSTGLCGPVSPGSIITILLLTNKANLLPILFSVFVSCLVTLLLAAIILKVSNKEYSNYLLNEYSCVAEPNIWFWCEPAIWKN